MKIKGKNEREYSLDQLMLATYLIIIIIKKKESVTEGMQKMRAEATRI